MQIIARTNGPLNGDSKEPEMSSLKLWFHYRRFLRLKRINFMHLFGSVQQKKEESPALKLNANAFATNKNYIFITILKRTLWNIYCESIARSLWLFVCWKSISIDIYPQFIFSFSCVWWELRQVNRISAESWRFKGTFPSYQQKLWINKKCWNKRFAIFLFFRFFFFYSSLSMLRRVINNK